MFIPTHLRVYNRVIRQIPPNLVNDKDEGKSGKIIFKVYLSFGVGRLRSNEWGDPHSSNPVVGTGTVRMNPVLRGCGMIKGSSSNVSNLE